MKINAQYVASILTIPFLACGLRQEPTHLPAEGFSVAPLTENYAWDRFGRQEIYHSPALVDSIEKLAIIHRVASALLEQSVDIDADIVAAIDKEFWNLM